MAFSHYGVIHLHVFCTKNYLLLIEEVNIRIRKLGRFLFLVVANVK